ncbi:MAG: hypothetical protein RL434_3108 [Pseudomonadota bacterium]|jgi:hypothetical protein
MQWVMVMLVCLLSLGVRAADPALPECADDPAPRAAVEGFMQSMKARQFTEAYDFVTATMTDGKPREEWAALQKKMFDLGGVSIGAIDVHAARREVLADGSCSNKAWVPNVLRAGDVLNTEGSTEYEVYTVLLEGGAWKIDSQETLFDEERISEWFPDKK